MKCGASRTRRSVQINEFKAVIKDMSNEVLNNIRNEIENSLKHLYRSNARLQTYIDKIEGREYHYQGNELLDDLTTEELNNIVNEYLQLYSESLNESKFHTKKLRRKN